MSPITFLSIIPLIASLLKTANGHGMMLDPPNRSSMWHYGFNVPPNYNDNGLNCGGFTVIRIFNSSIFSRFFMFHLRVQQVQHNGINQGRCGECGDEWSLIRPRSNDEGGLYGTGIIGQTYKQGSVCVIFIRIKC